MKENVVTRKLLLAFRDKLTKHLFNMKDRPQVEIINEVYKLITELTNNMED